MPTATIIFHQPAGDGYINPGSRADLVLYDNTSNTTITVANVNNTGVTSWLWTIVDKPTGSTAVFANGGGLTSTFTTDTFNPDVYGTYLISLVVNGDNSITDQKGAAVRTPNLGFRIPAAKETKEFSGTRGWAVDANAAILKLDSAAAGGTPTIQSVYDASGSGALQLSNAVGGLALADSAGGVGTLLAVTDFSTSVSYLSLDPINFTVNTSNGAQFSNLVDVGALRVDTTAEIVQAFQADSTSLFLDTVTIRDNTTSTSIHSKLVLTNTDTSVTNYSPAINFHGAGKSEAVSTFDWDILNIPTDSSNDKLSFQWRKNANAYAERMSIDQNGNVVITGNFTGAGGAVAYAGSYLPLTGGTLTGETDIIINNFGIGYSQAMLIENTSAATNVLNQWSPVFSIIGQFWHVSDATSFADGASFRIQDDGTVPVLNIQDGYSGNTLVQLTLGPDTPGLFRFDSLDALANSDDLNIGTIQADTITIGGGMNHTNSPNQRVWIIGGNQSVIGPAPVTPDAPELRLFEGAVILDSGGASASNKTISIGTSKATSITIGRNASTTAILGTLTVDGYTINPTSAVTGDALVYNGSAYVATPVTLAEADASDFLLTGTSPTTVVTFTPSAKGNFVVYVYYRVVTGTTNVGIDLTYTDGSGSQTTHIVPAATSTIVGSYQTSPSYINATAAAITVTATAGTGNQLYVSSSIVKC